MGRGRGGVGTRAPGGVSRGGAGWGRGGAGSRVFRVTSGCWRWHPVKVREVEYIEEVVAVHLPRLLTRTALY